MSDNFTLGWLQIIGLGEEWPQHGPNDVDLIDPQMRAALEVAVHIIGPPRFAALAEAAGKNLTPWASGFDAMLVQIKALRGEKTLVLATGDPSHFGIAGSLSAHLTPGEIHIVPSPSAFSKAAARLGWRLEECEMISLHGRDLSALRRVMGCGTPILALTSNGDTIHQAAQLYCQLGLEDARFDVLHHMGGSEEYRISCKAKDCADEKFGDFQLLAISPFEHHTVLLRNYQGPYRDNELIHDGQITKYEQRLLALAKLAPMPGELLLDIGAGCGAIALEWCRLEPSAFAICIEQKGDRAAMIRLNAQKYGLAHRLRVFEGEAFQTIPELFDAEALKPEAIFMGGGISDRQLLQQAWQILANNGRFVAHAVSLEGQNILYQLADDADELAHISVAKPHKLGTHQAMKPQLPIVQWCRAKTKDAELGV